MARGLHAEMQSRLNEYCDGSLVMFSGDQWLGDLSGQVGLILSKDTSNMMVNVMVNSRVLGIYLDEIEPDELTIVAKQVV
jgi:hypothetical protein